MQHVLYFGLLTERSSNCWHRVARRCRTYTYRVQGTLVGSYTNRVRIDIKDDQNPDNNEATADVVVQGTCGNPFGNGTTLTCGDLFRYVGPNGTLLSDPGSFQALCCVSTNPTSGLLRLTLQHACDG